jgi:excisionase family DNA binding protein
MPRPLGRQDSYSTGEVARICAVSVATVRKWCTEGLLRAYRLPGVPPTARRVKRQTLLAFLRQHGIPVPLWLEDADVVVGGGDG